MRVNIVYSAELEDVPREIERMLIECNEEIRSLHGQLSRAIGRDALTCIDELDKVRMKMATADIRLEECMKLLSGYAQTLAQIPSVEAVAPEYPAVPTEEIKDE